MAYLKDRSSLYEAWCYDVHSTFKYRSEPIIIDITIHGAGGHASEPDKSKNPAMIGAEFLIKIHDVSYRNHVRSSQRFKRVGSNLLFVFLCSTLGKQTMLSLILLV